ncbi:hypothetical protein IWQ57_004145 [Coemansia nantahalensis]|uniref:Uncharacterized protein n=2 Tax=Coemansia TaxID=4863 RepID=A0ACC1KSS6_9FUNG|nr:hypothetical protein IWQ57_004145 [Coemansia nantahalensis]KAJ2794636.1 hypothetical protein H4R21_005430 [Coemansia helicoidea]
MQLIGSTAAAIGAVFMMASSVFALPQSTPVQTDVAAIKDSTIYYSGTGCPTCPNGNCFECTWGNNNTLTAFTGMRSLGRALIGFQLPYDGSLVKTCTIQIPAFSTPLTADTVVTINRAENKDWEEATVNGYNAPAIYSEVASVTVPAGQNLGPVDISYACRSAQRGALSVYFSASGPMYSFWSKNSGNPAILHVTRYT